jgi:Zn-dependent metalloprotease
MKIKLLVSFCLIGGLLFAQQNQLTKTKKGDNFYVYEGEVHVSANQLVNSFKTDLGLTENDKLELLKKETDKLNITHYRYQQLYKGIPIYGAQYMVHEKNNKVMSSNGRLITGLSAGNQASIHAKEVLKLAKSHIKAEAYMWENVQEEALLKQMKNDVNATYLPKPELVYFDKYFTQVASNYKLAYKLEVYTKKPLAKQDVFIDAVTGEVLHAYNKIHTAEVGGTANTKYAGTQSIQVDSLSPTSYRLREYARGGGIETYNMLKGTNYAAAVDFTDNDNIWNNINAQQDEAATDAHWAAEMTYDYFFGNHGRDSYDNAGTILLSYVHYDVNYANAFWDGTRMTYGDGDGVTYSALTSLDVGGHEIAHGVTEYSANLIYQNESGALNESFSDIFGTAIEFYADPLNADWFIGEDFDINGNGFRSMSDPNSKGDPDTYLGVNWATGPNDNGGVHTNSSVQNYWFYLLSVGGVGTNDNNYSYNVTGLGIDTAAAIAYRNLTVYLTQSSNYWDARIGAIQSAEDLYGPCSNAVLETAKAWAAVGVGFPIEDNDLTILSIDNPATACGLTNAENVTIKIRNNGCTVDLLAGDTINVYFKVDAAPVINELITLTANFNAGDTITYTFTNTGDFSTIGMHSIGAWIAYHLDPQSLNDSVLNVAVENKIQQNYDLALAKVLSPTSDCHLSNAEVVNIAVQFLGCDSLVAGTSIDLAYQLNASPIVSETFVLGTTLYSEDTAYYAFTTNVDLSTHGSYNLKVWTAYATDVMNNNDTLANYKIKNPFPLSDVDTVTFESTVAVLDTTILTTNSQSVITVSNTYAAKGSYSLRMSGGDPINSGITPDLDSNGFWSNNIPYAAYAKFCVDATTWTSAYMQFDLKQTLSKVYNLQFGQFIPQASSLRVVVNGTQMGGTFNPATETSDPFSKKSFNLNAYAGTQFEVVFETRMGFKQSADPTAMLGSKGDNAFIDNILFTQTPVSVESIEALENIELYPNPTKGMFSLAYNSINNQQVVIEIYDMLGRNILVENKSITKGLNTINIDITNQTNGIYFVKVTSNDMSNTIRMIKN